MINPQISWFVIEDDTPTPYEEYYAGSYRPDESVEIHMQLWNNRWGQEEAENVTQGRLAVFFDSIEDSYLLGLCSIKIDSNDFVPLTINSGRGRVAIDRVLSGSSNTGSSNATGNYVNVVLKFGPVTAGIRNSLKNLYIDLEFDM